MASMVIRNIPDDVLDRLKEKARIAGKSTEQFAREALAEKARPSREELVRRMDEIRARSKPTSGQAIIDEIRSDRDHNLGRDIVGLADDH
jgi:plasmid stability protein